MIRSFGLHWHVDKVSWGRGGKLEGAASRSKRAIPVDFKLQRGVYALYSEYEIVYVGQTGAGENDRLFHRLKHHKIDHLAERWDRFSWFGTHKVTQTGDLTFDAATVALHVPVALNVLEAVSIAISEPRLNLQRGHWGEATQYYQYWEGTGEEDE